MEQHHHLIGLGIGPFHLSLAALMNKANIKNLFLDQKPHFHWHPELMFSDADMQTSYLKDLVTPVDPTSPFSFLNYLVQNGLFYPFMNTGRRVINRREFEMYCQWVSQQMSPQLKFNSSIDEVNFDGSKFLVSTSTETFTAQNLSIATGLVPRVPECAKAFIGKNIFHAKSDALQGMNLEQKRVLIVGGGQTGIEVFRNGLKGKWGRPQSIKLVSRRDNLQPLDESPFTNEYFTPSYVNEFFQLEQSLKDPIVRSQKLASDGNTPQYLEDLYKDLYLLKHVQRDELDFKILPQRSLIGIQEHGPGFKATFENRFLNQNEVFEADIIILSTGFCITTPKILDPIRHLLSFDSDGRFIINQNFDLDWKGPKTNKIYALNFSRHRHGIAEPQTSLMAWRSATIINDLLNEKFYNNDDVVSNFIQYGKVE